MHSLLKTLQVKNHLLRESLCSYVNEKLAKLSHQGRMRVQGVTLDTSTSKYKRKV